jgi:hypothetical protein
MATLLSGAVWRVSFVRVISGSSAKGKLGLELRTAMKERERG